MSRLPGAGLVRRAGRLQDALRDRIGSATVWNLVWLASVLVAGGVAIDAANGYRLKSTMQSAADLAALAAARHLPDPASQDRGASFPGTVSYGPYARLQVRPQEVVFGHWDAAGGFQPDDPRKNAAQVTLKRTATAPGLFTTNLLGLVGLGTHEIEVRAIAVRRGGVVDRCLDDDEGKGKAECAAPDGEQVASEPRTAT